MLADRHPIIVIPLQSEIQRSEICVERGDSDHALLVNMNSATGFEIGLAVLQPNYTPLRVG